MKRNIPTAQTMATVIRGRVESEMFVCSQLGCGVSSGYSRQGDEAQAGHGGTSWFCGSSCESGPHDMVIDASQMGANISKSATQLSPASRQLEWALKPLLLHDDTIEVGEKCKKFRFSL